MKKPVVLRAEADVDIESAIDRYSSEAPHVVDDFLAALEATIAALGKHPMAGSPRYAHELDMPGLRHRNTARFPYLVFYLEGPREISVLRVLHASRDIPGGLEPE